MNKLTIPTILVATVMVAGIFAFMPVDEAKAVHVSVQDEQMRSVHVLSLADLSVGITCTSSSDFIVKVIVGATEVDDTTVTVAMNGEIVTMTGDLQVVANVGADGYGATGASFTIAAEFDDTVVIDGTATVDVHVAMIHDAGATGDCV